MNDCCNHDMVPSECPQCTTAKRRRLTAAEMHDALDQLVARYIRAQGQHAKLPDEMSVSALMEYAFAIKREEESSRAPR